MTRVKALPRKAGALPRPIVRVAYLQTAGRGRRGRPWYAEPGNALLFSVACVLPRPLEGLAGLSLAVGVALVDGLRSLPVAGPGQIALKWPNDVLLEGDKLAGILIETAWSTDDASAVVIGIGTNVKGADELAAKVGALNADVPAASARHRADRTATRAAEREPHRYAGGRTERARTRVAALRRGRLRAVPGTLERRARLRGPRSRAAGTRQGSWRAAWRPASTSAGNCCSTRRRAV